MGASWLLVETPTQLNSFTDNGYTGQWLTTNPVVYRMLERRSQSPQALDSFLSRATADQMATRNLTIAKSLCVSLDERLHSSAPEFPDGLDPFVALHYQIKHTLDNLTFRWHSLQRLFETNRVDEIRYVPSSPVAFDSFPESYTDQQFIWQSEESPTALLLDVLEDDRCVALDTPAPRSFETDTTATADKPAVRELLADRESIWSFVRERLGTYLNQHHNMNRVHGLRNVGTKLMRSGTDSPVFSIIGQDDDIATFVDETISNRSVTVDWWQRWDSPPVSLRSGQVVTNYDREIEERHRHWDTDILRNIVEPPLRESELAAPVQEVLGDRLVRFGAAQLSYQQWLYRQAQRYFDRREPAAVLCGSTATDLVQVIAQAFDNHDGSFVSFQHGGLYGYVEKPSLSYSDIRVADIFCTYGDGVTGTLRDQAVQHEFSTNIVTTGWGSAPTTVSESESPLPTGFDDDKPVLAYVATGLVGEKRYGPYYWYSDYYYDQHQHELAAILGNVEGYNKIFKLHYKSAVTEPIKDAVAEDDETAIIRDQPLTEILPSVDVILLDWPATVLLEALHMDKPVIYLDLGWLKWKPSAKEVLQREITWFDTVGEWQESLVALLNDSTPMEEPSGEFLSQYGRQKYELDHCWKILFGRQRRMG